MVKSLKDIVRSGSIHDEEEFQEDVTELIKTQIEEMVDSDLEITDIKDIIGATKPKREIVIVDDNCIGCGACEVCSRKCPVGALNFERLADES